MSFKKLLGTGVGLLIASVIGGYFFTFGTDLYTLSKDWLLSSAFPFTIPQLIFMIMGVAGFSLTAYAVVKNEKSLQLKTKKSSWFSTLFRRQPIKFNAEALIISPPQKILEETFTNKASDILLQLQQQLNQDRRESFMDDLLNQIQYQFPSSPWKLNKTRPTVFMAVEFLEKEIPKSNSRQKKEKLLLGLQTILEKGDIETFEFVKERFLPIIDNYYETAFNRSDADVFALPVIVDLLQRFNKYSFEIMMKLVADALRRWSPEKYKNRVGSIALVGKFATNNREAFLKIRNYLRKVGTDPDENKTVSDRAFEWYNLIKDI